MVLHRIEGKYRVKTDSEVAAWHIPFICRKLFLLYCLLIVDVWYLFYIEQHEGQSEPFNYVVVKSKYFIVSTDYWKEAVNLFHVTN